MLVVAVGVSRHLHRNETLVSRQAPATLKPAPPSPPEPMKRFLRENWLWLVAPFLIVAIGLVVLLFVVGNEAENSGFVYNLG